jgi:hypothetical protein
MLERTTADTRTVVHRALKLAAWICCGFVIASFTLFTRDQLVGASAHQQNAIVSATSRPTAKAPSTIHHQPRKFIDAAAHDLLSPFSSIVQSNDQWVTHGIPTVLGLLVYGAGLGFLARYSRAFS